MDNQNNTTLETPNQSENQSTQDVTTQEALNIEQPAQEQEPEIAINQDGELEFNDSFFDDGDNETSNKQQGDQQSQQSQPAQPNLYTDEELNNTPFEQWDVERLPDDVKKYAQIQRQQLNQRQAYQQQLQLQQQQMQWQQQQLQQQPAFTEPKKLTPKELTQEALKLARERLGLADDAELEPAYEPEHMAAFNQALNEVDAKNKNEIADYQRRVNAYNDLMRFNQQMTVMPDFQEFDKWFTGKIKERNLTPLDIQKRLANFAQHGGGFEGVKNVISSWYHEFKQEAKNAVIQAQFKAQAQQKAPKPPVLEHSTGLNQVTGRNIDFAKFGDMDMFQQAKILKEIGVV